MAYVSPEKMEKVKCSIREAYPYFKWSISKEHHSTIRVTLLESDYDFSGYLNGQKYESVNHYWMRDCKDENVKNLFTDVLKIIKSDDFYDRSEPMTDYFDVSYYISLSIGRYDKPYKQNKKKESELVEKLYRQFKEKKDE
jgi:hypothetical protein